MHFLAARGRLDYLRVAGAVGELAANAHAAASGEHGDEGGEGDDDSSMELESVASGSGGGLADRRKALTKELFRAFEYH